MYMYYIYVYIYIITYLLAILTKINLINIGLIYPMHSKLASVVDCF